jgi:hypothetical protein
VSEVRFPKITVDISDERVLFQFGRRGKRGVRGVNTHGWGSIARRDLARLYRTLDYARHDLRLSAQRLTPGEALATWDYLSMIGADLVQEFPRMYVWLTELVHKTGVADLYGIDRTIYLDKARKWDRFRAWAIVDGVEIARHLCPDDAPVNHRIAALVKAGLIAQPG